MSRAHRRTEGILLLCASLVLLLGFFLVFLAKMPELRQRGAVNINTAGPVEIASVLGIDRALGRRIVEHRSRHGGFVSTSSLAEVPALSSDEARQVERLLREGAVDIALLTTSELARRTGISRGGAERIVGFLVHRPRDQAVTNQALAAVRAVSAQDVAARERSLRVREPAGVVFRFWLYVGMLISAFFVLHAILRKSAPLSDPFLLPVVLMLCGLGAVLLFSLKHPLRDTDVYTSQAHGILLGLVAAAVPLTRKFRSLHPWRYTYIYALVSVLLVCLLAVFGSGPGGARLRLMGMQPIEVVKIALAFFVAGYLADRWRVLTDRTGPRRRWRMPLFRDIAPLAVMYLLSLTTFVLVKDLGPMLVLFGMFVALLYVATGQMGFIGAGAGLIAVSGWLAYTLKLGVFDTRVDMWLSPWNNSHPNGMHLAQALWAFGSGGIWGSGLGLGGTDLMPRAGSDLAFASVGEELGLIGCVAVLFLYSVLMARGARIATRARSDFDRFLAASVTALLGIQTTVIVFGVVGLLPLTGITLPFVSFGKSSLVASFFAVGLLLNISSSSGNPETATAASRGLRALGVGLALLLLGVAGIGRLMWIQGIDADGVAGSVAIVPDADGVKRGHINPRLRSIEATIPRGSIYDRNGRVLATSRPSELRKLGLDDEAALRPNGRVYPCGRTLVHLLGYMDPRCGGPVGMESGWNNELRGFDDYADLLPIYRLSHTPFCPTLKGNDIRLAIDSDLQAAAERALREYAANVRDRRTGVRKTKGAAVVLDVYTGEVLAAASIPSFDPNGLTPTAWRAYNRDGSGEHILINRALNGLYPPGSTFKLVTAAAALESGLSLTHRCAHTERNVRWRWRGKTYSRRRITDLEEMSPHGTTNLARAVRVSCNVYFAHLGLTLGPERLYEMAERFRLTDVPPPRKLVEDLPDSAFGQGRILVSPLEMARVVAAIANNGVMMKPQFVKEVLSDGRAVKTIEPVELGKPISPETASVLRRMMTDVVAVGTGRGVFAGLNVSVAGKTGSAENDQADRMPHSWFVGFAPADDPRIAFAVVIENGGYGRAAGGPVCREIVRQAL